MSLAASSDAGMIVGSCVGIFIIPMLYVVFQRMRERGGQRRAAPTDKLTDEAGSGRA